MLSGCKVTTFLRDPQIFENKNSKPPHRLKWLGILKNRITYDVNKPITWRM